MTITLDTQHCDSFAAGALDKAVQCWAGAVVENVSHPTPTIEPISFSKRVAIVGWIPQRRLVDILDPHFAECCRQRLAREPRTAARWS